MQRWQFNVDVACVPRFRLRDLPCGCEQMKNNLYSSQCMQYYGAHFSPVRQRRDGL